MRVALMVFGLCLLGFVGMGQGLERRVGRLLERLDTMTLNSGGYDTIEKLDSEIMQIMVKGLNGNVASMQYPFKRWQDINMSIVDSKDGKLRIYSWDGSTGGAMRGYSSVVQYRDNLGVHAKALFDVTSDAFPDDPGNSYDTVYSVKISGRVYYLVVGGGIYGIGQLSAVVRTFRIDANGLNDSVCVFRDGMKLENKVERFYDAYKSRLAEEPIVRFDSINQRLLVRAVNDDNLLLKWFDVYSFDGRYFTKKSRKRDP
jgi:hypothetical protein